MKSLPQETIIHNEPFGPSLFVVDTQDRLTIEAFCPRTLSQLSIELDHKDNTELHHRLTTCRRRMMDYGRSYIPRNGQIIGHSSRIAKISLEVQSSDRLCMQLVAVGPPMQVVTLRLTGTETSLLIATLLSSWGRIETWNMYDRLRSRPT